MPVAGSVGLNGDGLEAKLEGIDSTDVNGLSKNESVSK